VQAARVPDRGGDRLSVIASEGDNGVQAEWELDELIDAWTLTGGDWT
jgi:hypothetical protein